jgi:hypothetical protein
MSRSSELFKGVPRMRDAVEAKGNEAVQIADLVFGPYDVSRPIIAPPNVPHERVAALRKALSDTMADPKTVADGKKLGIDWKPLTGDEVEKLLNKLYHTPKAIVAKAIAVTKP